MFFETNGSTLFHYQSFPSEFNKSCHAMPPRYRGQVDGLIKFVKLHLRPSAPELMLPPEFVRRYGDDVPLAVTLVSPTGRKWPVEVAFRGDDRFFREGWPQFRDHYRIQMGYLILTKTLSINQDL